MSRGMDGQRDGWMGVGDGRADVWICCRCNNCALVVRILVLLSLWRGLKARKLFC